MPTYNQSSGHKLKFEKGSKSEKINNLSFGVKFRVLFSGVMMTIGISFTLVGLPIFFVFFALVDFNDFKFSDDSPTTKGYVTDIIPTSSYVNDVQIYRYCYEYTVDGKKYTGECHQPGNYEITETDIQYIEGSPEISRIDGMKLSSFPLWTVLMVLIFPIIGVFMTFFGIKKNLNYIKILEVGRVSFGKFNRMEATGSKVNNATVMKMFFDFVADDGIVYQATGETHLIHNLQDEQLEPLVFNPSNPSEAIMIDALPRVVRKTFQKDIDTAKIRFEEKFINNQI